VLKLDSKAHLDRLITEDIQESLTLDYKDAAALGRSNNQRNELCKDVSAFANSAGGQIVYGMQETGHHPTRVQDADGVDPTIIPREWIERVIDSNVQPRIDGLLIKPIDVAPGRVAYVITAPQAMGKAPHMAPDHKYYYRQNFQSVPMEDYQVRDALKRATTPELYVMLVFATGPVANIQFPHQSELSNPITIVATVGNRSSQPAFHAHFQIGIDTDLPLRAAHDFYAMGITGFDQQQYWLGHRFSSPPELPIFKEIDPTINHRLSLTVAYPAAMLGGEHLFHLTTSIQTPGYTATENWKIHHRGSTLTMCEPGHPLNR
jgi:hypothetical protein